MSGRETKRDYKGWLSIVIGACAVWISYETFMWQKSQSESSQPDATAPGQQSTSGSGNETSGSSDTYQPETSSSEPESETAPDKGEKGKKNKKNR